MFTTMGNYKQNNDGRAATEDWVEAAANGLLPCIHARDRAQSSLPGVKSLASDSLEL